MDELNPGLIPELASLSPRSTWTRRDFMVSTLAAGFALAVEPVSAQTIATDAKGLTAGGIRIPGQDRHIPRFLPPPTVRQEFSLNLVGQENFCLQELHREQ